MFTGAYPVATPLLTHSAICHSERGFFLLVVDLSSAEFCRVLVLVCTAGLFSHFDRGGYSLSPSQPAPEIDCWRWFRLIPCAPPARFSAPHFTPAGRGRFYS
jgi:hypothetical protein